MDREDFIITIYCLVCEYYEKIVGTQRLRQRGFPPALTDAEVITIEVCGEYIGLAEDEAMYEYFHTHYQEWFPELKQRTQFVRQAADLWQVKAMIQQRLTIESGQAKDPIQPIDTLPLPVCVYTRSRRNRCFKPEADYGYCPAKDLHYFGFKLGLRISRAGMITHYDLLPARPHDVQLLDDLLAGFEGVALADKGFIDAFRQQQLALRRRIELITPGRKNMKATISPALRRICQRLRKRIETVGSQLTERFHIAQTSAHDLWHYRHRIIRKVLAHTICVFINLQSGRPPLNLDALLSP